MDGWMDGWMDECNMIKYGNMGGSIDRSTDVGGGGGALVSMDYCWNTVVR